jgi:DNA-binding NtrC family response regulator
MKPVAMPPPVPSHHPNFMPDRILVVDDAVPVRRLMVRVLRTAGFEPLEACSAADAVRILREVDEPLAAVISDVEMPGLFVMRLVEQARVQNPHVAILLVSGGHSDPEALEAIERGDLRLLPKPFTGSQLLLYLREEMRRG